MGQTKRDYRWVTVPVSGDWSRCMIGRLADLERKYQTGSFQAALGGLSFDRRVAERMVDDLNTHGYVSVEPPE